MTDSEKIRPIAESPRFHGERPVAEVVGDIRDESLAFVATRVGMLVSELRDGLAAMKRALPLLILGSAVAGTAWLVLTAGLIVLVAAAFTGNPYAYLFASAIVGLVYLLVGVVMLWAGRSRLKGRNLLPSRTFRTLSEDFDWVQNEARKQT